MYIEFFFWISHNSNFFWILLSDFFTIVNFTWILLNFEVNTLKFNISIKKTPTIMIFLYMILKKIPILSINF
jgi:hypothetical protein